MIVWGKDNDPGDRANRAAEIAAAVLMVGYALLLLGHIIAAWLRGSFEVIAR